jgi:hypothetical protein
VFIYANMGLRSMTFQWLAFFCFLILMTSAMQANSFFVVGLVADPVVFEDTCIFSVHPDLAF